MNDDVDHINELEKRLYTRDPDNIPKRKFGILRPVKQNVSSTWGIAEIPHDHTVRRTNVTGYKRFFIVTLGFFLLALGIALFSFFQGAAVLSSKNVDVNIVGNSFVAGGENLPVQVEIVNKNSADLIDAEVTIQYPKGAITESSGEMVNQKKMLGTIPSGKTKSESFTVVLYGEQGISREITAVLTYKQQGTNAVFKKEQKFSVMISSSPLALTVDAPSAIGSNQPFTLSIRNSFTGDTPLEGAVVRVEYPQGFVFQSAVPAPVPGNTNVWTLGTLEKGSEQVIQIKGKIVGEENDEKSFRIAVGERQGEGDNRIGVAYNSTLHTVHISRPFLAATISINGETGSIAAIPIDSPVKGTINWINSSPNAITNALFELSLDGAGVVLDSVSPEEGYFDQTRRVMIWNAQSNNALASIAPGQSGQLSFSFDTTSAQRADINLALSVAGTFPERDNATSTIANIDEKIIRFASRLQFASQALYSSGPIKNTGPFPPKADQETTYTIVWTIKPTDNALTNIRASAILPAGVIWAGVIVPQSEVISYNTETREIVWSAGSLPKAIGTPLSRTVSFQIKVKPTKSQIGTELSLLGETTLTATDTVANVPLTASRRPLTTRLDTDPAYTAGKERVIP
jgi:hypothetical protein